MYESFLYKSTSSFKRQKKRPFELKFWRKRLMYDIHYEKRQLERLVNSNKFILVCTCPNFNKSSLWLIKKYFNSFIQSNIYYPYDRLARKYPIKQKLKFFPYSNILRFYKKKNYNENLKRLLTCNHIHFPFHNIPELENFIKISKQINLIPQLFFPIVIINKFKNKYIPIQFFKLSNLNINNENKLNLKNFHLNFLMILKQIFKNFKLIYYKKLDDSCEPPYININITALPNPIHPLKGNNPKLDKEGNVLFEYDSEGNLIMTEEDESQIIDSFVSSSENEEKLKKRTWFNKFLRRTFG